MGQSGPAGSLACLGTPGLAGEALGCCCFWVLHRLPWETSYLSSTETHPGPSCRCCSGAGVEGQEGWFWLLPPTIPPICPPSPPLPKVPIEPRIPCWLLAGLSGLLRMNWVG